MNKQLVLALSALSLSLPVAADVRINGFANLIGGMTSSDDNFFDYDDNISFDNESAFAIQVSGDINDKMTATGQVIARGQDNYDAEFVWAYLSYQATDNTSISAGRLRLPLFRYSASLDVGYSYHWVTVPQVIYDVPFNNLDGVRVDYSNYSGDWEYNLQFAAGTYDSEINGVGLDANNVLVVTAEATYDWLKIRAVVGRGNTTFDTQNSALAPAFGALQTLSPALADDLDVNDDTGTFLGLGVEVDKFDWFVSAEVTEIETEDSFSPKDTAYYITAGMRIGTLTPSITHESRDGNNDLKYTDRAAAFPAELRPTVAGLIAGVQLPFMEEYDITTLGLRYDFEANVALKADISRLSDDLNSDNDATRFRVAVNYVF